MELRAEKAFRPFRRQSHRLHNLRAEYAHTNNIFMSSLARMLSISGGDGGTTSSVLPGSDSPEKTSEPIGSLGRLAEQQLATPSFRNMRPQDREEWQKAIRCPASPKKGKLDQVDDMRIYENVFAKLLEDMVNRVLGASTVEDRQRLLHERVTSR